MRRSICYCDPAHTQAGCVNTWNFIYTPANNLPKGTKLKFDMLSSGRDIDWEIPLSDVKKTKNVIFGKLDNGKILPAKEIELPDRYTPQYEFVLPKEIKAGNPFTITVGSPKEGTQQVLSNGNGAQMHAQRRRPFYLYIDTTGKGHYDEPEVFSMDIRGNTLSKIRVLTPSFVGRNKRFDVILRFEDTFGNLTSQSADETLVELTYEQLRENLSWKLFIPETGFLSLPNLYFNEPGFYTIQLKNLKTKEQFRSAPIKCFPDGKKSLFWGILHGESERFDSTENIENCLRHFRDEQALHFYISSPFESSEETPNDVWRFICQNLSEFDEDERFCTLNGFQWHGESPKEGIRQMIFAKETKQILRKKEAKNQSLQRIYKNHTPKEMISIPCFTMGKGFEFDFKNFNPDFERVVEIYNAWGSSEFTKKQGNTFPIHTTTRNGVKESPLGALDKALMSNCRFGFVGGGLDDRGPYGELYDSDQVQYTPGLTGIIASDLTRSALFDALYNRHCYATTGEHMIVGLYLAGLPMGSEVDTVEKHGLLINRHLSGYVAGTEDVKCVEIIRNGTILKTYRPKDGYKFEFTYDDMEPMKKITIDAKDKNPPFIFYYLRVTQADGHMAWSSPIWVDYVEGKPSSKRVTKATQLKVKPVLDFDVDDEDEEEDLDDVTDDSSLA